MTTSMKLAGVCAAILAGSSVFAQQAPAPAVETTSSGLLGTRYVEAGFGVTDINHFGLDLFSTGVSVNLPVASSLDVGVAYSYSWLESVSDFDAHTLAASVTEFVDVSAVQGLKAFGTATLGYQWIDNDDEETFWGLDLGVEYSLTSKLSASASVGYVDNFHGPSDDGAWDGTVRANYWLTDSVVANVALSIVEGGTVVYGAGASLKF